jgi:hypothetical protein
MPTVQQLIAASDRQIDRLKLRVQREMVHVDDLERADLSADAKRARIALDHMLGELAFLQRYRLSLYQEPTFEDAPSRKAS